MYRTTVRALFLGLAFQCLTTLASASSDYPDALKSALTLAGAPPQCTLCHKSDNGGPNTVVTPFGRTLVSQYSVRGQNKASLLAAIQAEQRDGVDSDCDGVPDIEELRQGRDPNKSDLDGGRCAPGSLGPSAANQYPELETGCSLGRHPVPASGAALMGLTAMAVSLRTKRRRRR